MDEEPKVCPTCGEAVTPAGDGWMRCAGCDWTVWMRFAGYWVRTPRPSAEALDRVHVVLAGALARAMGMGS